MSLFPEGWETTWAPQQLDWVNFIHYEKNCWRAALLEPPDHLDQLDQPDHPGNPDHLDHLDHLDQLDYQDHPDHPGTLTTR